MQTSYASATKNSDFRSRLFFLLCALIVFRIGSHLPVPGIDPVALGSFFANQKSGILGMFNVFSGGSLSRFSVFALGIMPYISASIIVQLAGAVVPSLEALKKDGEHGRRKLTQYTRYLTLILAIVQAYGISFALQSQAGLVFSPGPFFQFVTTVSLVTGTMFLVWLGEQITERGIGNGISMLIFAGIVSGVPGAIVSVFELVSSGALLPLISLFAFFLVVVVTFLVVYVERGQRKITLNYAKRQNASRLYESPRSHFPLKVNVAGVIPPIFASSIILLPASFLGWFGGSEADKSSSAFLSDLVTSLSPGHPLYMMVYALAIVFFAFFYTALVFNAREVSDNLKKSGAFLPGVRPGVHTSQYIDKILTRLTLFGALYLVLVCLLPEVLIYTLNLPFYFGGTSLLIIVVVSMDFMTQVQTHAMTQKYHSLLSKSSFSGSSR